MRRAAGFEIADHIATGYEGDDYVGQVMQGFADYIRQETLSREISAGIPAENDRMEELSLGGHDLKLSVRKLS